MKNILSSFIYYTSSSEIIKHQGGDFEKNKRNSEISFIVS